VLPLVLWHLPWGWGPCWCFAAQEFSPPVAACSTKKRVGVATWVLVVACPQLMHTHGCLVCCSDCRGPTVESHSPNTTPAESPPQPSRGVGTPGTTLWSGCLRHMGYPQVAWCPTGPTAWPTGLLPKGPLPGDPRSRIRPIMPSDMGNLVGVCMHDFRVGPKSQARSADRNLSINCISVTKHEIV